MLNKWPAGVGNNLGMAMKQLVVFIVFALFVVVLSGCALGVTMTEAEQAACRKDGCSVWTMDELRALAAKAFRAGHEAGHAAGKAWL